jgi:hypothetical protein
MECTRAIYAIVREACDGSDEIVFACSWKSNGTRTQGDGAGERYGPNFGETISSSTQHMRLNASVELLHVQVAELSEFIPAFTAPNPIHLSAG